VDFVSWKFQSIEGAGASDHDERWREGRGAGNPQKEPICVGYGSGKAVRRSLKLQEDLVVSFTAEYKMCDAQHTLYVAIPGAQVPVV